MASSSASSRRNTRWSRQLARGVTLVELLVAMTLSLVVIGAASGVYLISSQSFTTMDGSSQLQDSARFATYILRRMAQQTGYEDYSQYARDQGRSQSLGAYAAGAATCVQSDICGFDNRVVPIAAVTSGGPGTTGTLAGPFYTDTLVVQFQGQSVLSTATGEPTKTPDGSMIDCAGNGVPSSTVVPPTRAMSSMYVAINSVTNEPELYCSSRDPATGAARPAWGLVKGVEVFQVMYEIGNDVDTTTDPLTGIVSRDGIPDRFRWVSADQVAGMVPPIFNPSGGKVSDIVNAWQNVVAVRFGLVIRGELNTAPNPTSAVTLYPLGRDLADATNPATTYVPPIDTRLRRVVTFTVHIRNKQNAFFSI